MTKPTPRPDPVIAATLAAGFGRAYGSAVEEVGKMKTVGGKKAAGDAAAAFNTLSQAFYEIAQGEGESK